MGVATPPSAQAARREQLADFLRARRGAVAPGDVGLPAGGTRRTPGLRREELAALSGVGLSWLTWLEQGRDINPSPQVLDALARALRLTAVEHEHLFHLAGVARPLPDTAYVRTATDELEAIVDALMPHPAYLLGPRSDVLASNRAAATVLHDFGADPPERRNLLWWLFGDDERWARIPNWEATARRKLAQFRAEHARHPADPSFTALIDALSAHSAAFRDWWPRHEVVVAEPGRKVLEHATLGHLELFHLQTVPTAEPDLRLTVFTPADAVTRAALATLL